MSERRQSRAKVENSTKNLPAMQGYYIPFLVLETAQTFLFSRTLKLMLDNVIEATVFPNIIIAA